MPISTKDCVKAITRQFPNYGKAWKRLSKKKDINGRDVRVFQHAKDVSLVITVLATKDEIVQVIPPLEAPNLKGIPEKDLLEKIKKNKIKVSLAPTPPDADTEEDQLEEHKSLSGRVIYTNGEVRKDKEGNIEEFTFFCGCEGKKGYISDIYDGGLDEKLGELFSDINEVAHNNGKPGIDIGAAENMHVVCPLDGLTPDELWEIIRKRLERSGAVPYFY